MIGIESPTCSDSDDDKQESRKRERRLVEDSFRGYEHKCDLARLIPEGVQSGLGYASVAAVCERQQWRARPRKIDPTAYINAAPPMSTRLPSPTMASSAFFQDSPPLYGQRLSDEKTCWILDSSVYSFAGLWQQMEKAQA